MLACELTQDAAQRSTLLLVWGMLSATHTDPSTLPSWLPSAFADRFFTATNIGLSLYFPPTCIKLKHLLHEGCSRRTLL